MDHKSALLSTIRDRAISVSGKALSTLVSQRAPVPDPSAVLVLKPCCLGDVVLSTPVLAALRRAFPSARIDYAVGSWSAPALANNPRLDGQIDCGLVGSGRRYPVVQYRQLVQRVRAGRYDWCLILERSAVTGAVPWLAGVPHRIGLDSAGRGFVHTRRVPVLRGQHEAETYLNVARAAGVPVDDPHLEFFPTEEEQWRAASMLPRPCSWLAIHPGGGTNPGMRLEAKRWPAEHFARIVSRARQEGIGVVLVGAEYDAPLAAQVQQLAGRQPGIRNLAGQTTLGELAALLQRCVAFLGNDTGAMHLAVAVGTPPVALFGPTDPQMYGPYRLGVALRARLPCSPCFIDGRAPRCAAPACMASITVEEVWQALQQVIASRMVR